MYSIEEITIAYEEEGIEVIKELDKEILSKGAWTTILFRYQEWNKTAAAYGEAKFSIRRYQKQHGEYRPKAKFNISSADQAQKIIETLGRWLSD